VPLTDPINQIVTCADSACVTDVMVNGRFVMQDRRIGPINMADLRERVRGAVERLRTTITDARALAARLEPQVVAFAESLLGEPMGIERLIASSCG
jgi:cytosine/adenosine deaminase-related metal-dependent hydrolase